MFEDLVDKLTHDKNTVNNQDNNKSTTHKNFVLSGGVAANIYLKNKLSNSLSIKNYRLEAPPIKLCTDNAAMIAWAGLERLELGLLSNTDFCPRARWNLEDL
jgi:N6-L-threonylcarbamoyladenine synthase